MKLLILLLSICFTLEIIQQLPQNSYVYTNGNQNFYLDLNGYKSGDNVYIEITYNDYNYPTILLQYRQSNYYSTQDFSYPFSTKSSYSSSLVNYKRTYYYSITLNGNYKYLLLNVDLRNNYSYYYTITHSKSSYAWIIIVSISAFVAIVALSVIIYWCKRRHLPDYANRIDDPLVRTYPDVQPQPQPIYVQPVYPTGYVVQPAYP